MARYFVEARASARKIAGRLGRRLIRYAAGDSNLLHHAITEWARAFPQKDEMQDMVGESVFDVCSIFSLEGHSGFSAAYTTDLIERVLRYQVLSPLTGADDEWLCYAEEDGTEFFQNRRDSRVFKNGRNGAAYMIDGRIFREPSGATYTSGNSKVDLPPFPCYPPQPLVVDVDENGDELLDLTSALAKFEDFSTGDKIEIAPTPDGKVMLIWTDADGLSVDKVTPSGNFVFHMKKIFNVD